jgi:ABC-type sugar transport system ATPase subunit
MTMGDRIVIMKDGVVQQVGTPAELYRKPKNRFVAGFIGSPPMNFSAARIEPDGEGKRLRVGDFLLPYEGSLDAGSTVEWGIRPEALKLAEPGSPGCIRGAIELVEPLGAETQLYFSMDGSRFVAKADMSFAGAIGQDVWLRPAMDSSLYFDPETGEALP